MVEKSKRVENVIKWIDKENKKNLKTDTQESHKKLVFMQRKAKQIKIHVCTRRVAHTNMKPMTSTIRYDSVKKKKKQDRGDDKLKGAHPFS